MPSLLLDNPLMVIAVSLVLLIAAVSVAASGVITARKRAARRHRDGALPPMMVTGVRDKRDRPAPVTDAVRDGVQVLPGHLEVEVGNNVGEAIRFMRLNGEPADITIGAAEGPRHRHIKLPADTISRTHARMQYEQGRWRITNLSASNPTLVNGQELGATVPRTRVLDDGDMIQIGDMQLRFRAD